MINRIKTIESRAWNVDQTRNASRVFKVLMDTYPQFDYWSGSHNEILHHYGMYGLNTHTCEVIELGLSCLGELHLQNDVDRIEYFYAALFHDTGKLFDYEMVDENIWKPTEHRRVIHHLPRSVLIWHDIVKLFPEVNEKYHDKVMHAILAHHGRRDAGSPVAPKSRVAWLLHLCDGISARMNDCERLDVVNRPSYV